MSSALEICIKRPINTIILIADTKILVFYLRILYVSLLLKVSSPIPLVGISRGG